MENAQEPEEILTTPASQTEIVPEIVELESDAVAPDPSGKELLPINPPSIDPGQPVIQSVGAVQIINIEEPEVLAAAPGEPVEGQGFFFGELGMIEFEDGTKFHATQRHEFVADKALIEKLTTISEQKPGLKIFLET